MCVPGPMKWIWWSLAGRRSWMIFKRHLVQLSWSLSSNQVEMIPLSSSRLETYTHFLSARQLLTTHLLAVAQLTIALLVNRHPAGSVAVLTVCWPVHSQSQSNGQGLADFPKLNGLLHDVTQYGITVCLIQNTLSWLRPAHCCCIVKAEDIHC